MTNAKTVVITGASRGIGAATARRLASGGHTVVLLARTESALHAVAKDVQSAGGKAIALPCDLGDERSIEAASREALAQTSAIDAIINNAGTLVRSDFSQTALSQWRSLFDVNVFGLVSITQAFLPALQASQGRIVNVSSISGRVGTPKLSAYCASKHAVLGITRSLAEEMRDSGVTVTAVCPGSVDTDMLRQGLPGAKPDIAPSEVADLLCYLSLECPRTMTGSCVDILG